LLCFGQYSEIGGSPPTSHQVDESTVQTVKVELNSWDEIKDNLFLAWLIFVGIIITLLLFGLLVRVIWPFFKGDPIKFSLEKTIIEKSTGKMNKRKINNPEISLIKKPIFFVFSEDRKTFRSTSCYRHYP